MGSKKVVRRRCPKCGLRVEVVHAEGRVFWKNHRDRKGEWCYPGNR